MDVEELLLLMENRVFVTKIDVRILLDYRSFHQNKDNYKVRAVLVAHGCGDHIRYGHKHLEGLLRHLAHRLLKEREQLLTTIWWLKIAKDNWYVKPKSTIFEEMRGGWRGREKDGDLLSDMDVIMRCPTEDVYALSSLKRSRC